MHKVKEPIEKQDEKLIDWFSSMHQVECVTTK